MITPDRIVWDEANEAAHVAKHGVPFELAIDVFLDPDRLETSAKPDRFGAPRFKVVGSVDGVFYAVIFAMRGSAAHIVSIRRAGRRERPWQPGPKP